MLINNQPANRTLCASHTDVFPLNQFSRTVCGHEFSVVRFPSCFVASTLNRQKINKYVFFLACVRCMCVFIWISARAAHIPQSITFIYHIIHGLGIVCISILSLLYVFSLSRFLSTHACYVPYYAKPCLKIPTIFVAMNVYTYTVV